MERLVTLIPLFPLAGFLYITFFSKGLSKNFIGSVGASAILLSFITSIAVFTTQLHGNNATIVSVFDWIHTGSFSVDIAFVVDPLSTIYLLFITGVAFLIHVYSIGYMHEDEGFSRFFAYLNLFVFFMLILVLGDSYLTMFVGWEGVGLCSYMLIGFWYKDMRNNEAAKKAFIFNRVGDLGFILGMTLIFAYCGTLSFGDLFIKGNDISGLSGNVATAAAILLFVGAMGKSAQIPLHAWLPDAMAGPTPVSALIHAATMVTAGIYMVARSSALFEMSESASNVVVIAGILTALLGASVALTQNDIKKVLAYSTVSQLGFMFVALGLGAYSIAVFHVITHAFFKALLFLGSGSVIHAMGGEQDIRRMGGLKKWMPVTYWTFLIGTIAICGIFPFAGFFSKDQIMAYALELNIPVFALLMLASAGTAFYMFRMFYLTFHGNFRGTESQAHHLHESPRVMTLPLVVLAVLSVIGGFIGFPHAIGEEVGIHHWLDHFLEDTVAPAYSSLSVSAEIILALIAMAIAGGLIYYAHLVYIKKNSPALEDEEVGGGLHRLFARKFWFDELYEAAVRKPMDALAAWFSRIIEPRVIDNMVEGSGRMTRWTGESVRGLQNGSLSAYLVAIVGGTILVLIWLT